MTRAQNIQSQANQSGQCIGDSMRSGVFITWIADWIRVHINKAASHPL